LSEYFHKEEREIVSIFLIGCFYTMAAFMLTLDFSFHLSLILPALMLPTMILHKHADITEDGFLTVVRAVCRIE
jgi:hypothetical protein